MNSNSQISIRAITLLELLISLVMFAVLIGVTALVFHTLYLGFNSLQEHSKIGIALNSAKEHIMRDLRGAREPIGNINSNEIRFTQDGAQFYIYYLFNPTVPYPYNFADTTLRYDLKKAQLLTANIGGQFTYGSGRLIFSGILSPPQSNLTFSSGFAVIDLTVPVTDEEIHSYTQVRPRNLP